jgi:hypothetical protein
MTSRPHDPTITAPAFDAGGVRVGLAQGIGSFASRLPAPAGAVATQ